MNDYHKAIDKYRKERFKIPTYIFTTITVISLFALLFYGKSFMFWQNGAIGLIASLSAFIFAYRHGHDEGFIEGLYTDINSEQKVMGKFKAKK
jgi:hypothetical protein